MATIALYAKQTNAMPGLFESLRKAENKLKQEISDIKKKILKVDSDICDLNETIQKVTASTQIMEDRMEELEALEDDAREFINNTVEIDENVAQLVDKNKDDFYKKYAYLKPGSEKSVWDKICEKFEAAWEWCKRNVMLLTVIAVVTVAVVTLLCGVALTAIVAIAGVISVLLVIVDGICKILTKKSLEEYCTEKGMHNLGQILQGIYWGCELICAAFPLGSAVKSIFTIGYSATAEAMWIGIKTGLKRLRLELWEEGFKKGIWTGAWNSVKIGFRNFVFDPADFYQVRDGKRVFTLLDQRRVVKNPGEDLWKKKGNYLYPTDAIPTKCNPNHKTMKELLAQYHYKGTDTPIDKIPLDRFGQADMSLLSIEDVDMNIGEMISKTETSMYNMDAFLKEYNDTMNGIKVKYKRKTGTSFTYSDEFGNNLRRTNLKQADLNLSEKLSKYDIDISQIKKGADNQFYKKLLEKELNLQLVGHEDFRLKKVYYVPSDIHMNLTHSGAIARTKIEISHAFRATKNLIRGMAGYDIPRVTTFLIDALSD